MALHSTIKDTGAFFTIVPETREVKVPQTHKVIGVVGDHMAEQLTFEIPETIDGHDISGCARRYVVWKNVDGELGTDQLVPLDESPEGAKEGMLYFAWTIRDKLAAVKGVVEFSLHFEDVSEDGEHRLYHWGTTACKNCEILDSINHVIGVYAAMYVAGDTLVIADYTPVESGALALETPGIVPEGTMKITENGVHDVGTVAQVDVAVYDRNPTLKMFPVKISLTNANVNYRTYLSYPCVSKVLDTGEIVLSNLMTLMSFGVHDYEIPVGVKAIIHSDDGHHLRCSDFSGVSISQGGSDTTHVIISAQPEVYDEGYLVVQRVD